MPSAQPVLSVASAAEQIRASCCQPTSSERIGLEIEMLPVGADGVTARHDVVSGLLDGLGPLPSGTPVSFEPGGQVELSPSPVVGVESACRSLAADLATVAGALAGGGVTLVGMGLDPYPGRSRVGRSPRYDAMTEFFDARGPSGRLMMCRSAGMQVNLDWGPTAEEAARRWDLAHALGPVLAASFANSPMTDSGPTGWKSSRLANWWLVDPSRTSPVDDAGRGPESWVDYALGAQVLLIRRSAERYVPVGEPLSFAQWIRRGHPLGFPTSDDLDYHLGTLFPPVRPRPWLELRIADSLPEPWWQVSVLVSTALLLDPVAAETVASAAGPTRGLWEQASREGLREPHLAVAAPVCFEAALDACPRLGVGPELTDTVADYADRFVNQGRCPADDTLDTWSATGAAPAPSSLAAAAPPAPVP